MYRSAPPRTHLEVGSPAWLRLTLWNECTSTLGLAADALQQSKGKEFCQEGHNRFMTVFVYLNDCIEGGCTTFPRIGLHYGPDGESFYDKPGPFDTTKDRNGAAYKTLPGTGSIDVRAYCEPPLRIAPRRGLACIHFPSLTPEHGGTTDGNVVHQSEPAVRCG